LYFQDSGGAEIKHNCYKTKAAALAAAISIGCRTTSIQEWIWDSQYSCWRRQVTVINCAQSEHSRRTCRIIEEECPEQSLCQ
jgi:hypothetical protein